ncbi:MAG: hypothetical protein BJ554DRAFT_3867 [Olpidium bornovanus]|uniref:Uncharacterized protein n=1 Tax=Olpidium bornovanus TaxID=278681 RepID=A0A8H7ZNI2_9FUNG|nr:MAG: hypothetical protein BJ554DRAFT_3867 [Olpidium bornovanus]
MEPPLAANVRAAARRGLSAQPFVALRPPQPPPRRTHSAVGAMAHTVQKAEIATQPRLIKSEPLQDADAKWCVVSRPPLTCSYGILALVLLHARESLVARVFPAVIIFPILLSGKKAASLAPVDDDRETVLVLQFRPPVGKIVVELPAGSGASLNVFAPLRLPVGLVDANESVEEAAVRA